MSSVAKNMIPKESHIFFILVSFLKTIKKFNLFMNQVKISKKLYPNKLDSISYGIL